MTVLTKAGAEELKKMMVEQGLLIMEDVDEQFELEKKIQLALRQLDKAVEGKLIIKNHGMGEAIFNPSQKKMEKIMETWYEVKPILLPTIQVHKQVLAQGIAGWYQCNATAKGNNARTLAIVPLLFAYEVQDAYDRNHMPRLSRIYREHDAWEEIIELMLPAVEKLSGNKINYEGAK
ncbi:hypothetical protein ACIP97_24350 [Peribacillus frigoritolerans]|uniref:hypothetical protein n=1 Tax=Peribacillus frigoritolerans TaxID=450367 RepID=UPI0038199C5B